MWPLLCIYWAKYFCFIFIILFFETEPCCKVQTGFEPLFLWSQPVELGDWRCVHYAQLTLSTLHTSSHPHRTSMRIIPWFYNE